MLRSSIISCFSASAFYAFVLMKNENNYGFSSASKTPRMIMVKLERLSVYYLVRVLGALDFRPVKNGGLVFRPELEES